MLMKYLSTRLLPVARMSVTVAVGWPSALTVADGLPPSVLTLTANVASNACIDIVTSQSPTNGDTCAGVAGAGAAPCGDRPSPRSVVVGRGKKMRAITKRPTIAERRVRGMNVSL
jgi:hypothetical protein